VRVAGWQAALAAVVEEWRHRPFAYGSADCFQWTAAAVQAVTGIDYRDRFPNYGTALGAGRILCRVDGVAGLITSILGPPKPVAYATEGDVVAGEFGEGMTAGVCLGVHCASPGPGGLVFRRTASATTAWSI
jgi:hypothetical protein